MATIILDRDGVINHDSDDYIKTPNEWQIIDGAADAISRFNKAGYYVAVATNQSGIGRGILTPKQLQAIHNKMHTTLRKAGAEVNTIAFCPHVPTDNCSCRKPRCGLLQTIYSKTPCNPDADWMIGDTLKDIEAGHRMGLRSALVTTGKGYKYLKEEYVSREIIPIFESLGDFCDWLLPHITKSNI